MITISTVTSVITYALLGTLPFSAAIYQGCLFELVGSGNFTSPDYPDFYPNDQTCQWRLTALPGRVIRLLIFDLDLEPGFDFLVIYNNSNDVRNIFENLTGILPYKEVAYGSKVTVVFTSDSSIQLRGFQAYFDSVWPADSTLNAHTTCGKAVQRSAVITTPAYPNKYPPGMLCTWTLTADPGKVVKLRFKDFDLGQGRDSLNVYGYDSVTMTPTTLSYTGTTFPQTLTLGQNATLVFESRSFLQSQGFLALFTTACEFTLSEQGTLTSPNYPNYYPGFATCLWTLNAGHGSAVTLTFASFDLEQDDSVEVYNSQGILLSRFTGGDMMRNFTASFDESSVTVAFYSNIEDVTRAGFSASFVARKW